MPGSKTAVEARCRWKNRKQSHIRLSVQSQPEPVCIQSERAQVSSLSSHFHSTADKRPLRVEVVLHLFLQFWHPHYETQATGEIVIGILSLLLPQCLNSGNAFALVGGKHYLLSALARLEGQINVVMSSQKEIHTTIFSNMFETKCNLFLSGRQRQTEHQGG